MDSQRRPPALVLWGWQCCPCRGVDLPRWAEGSGQIKSGLAHRVAQACPWCSAQMVRTHVSTSAHTPGFILGGQMWGFKHSRSSGCLAFRVYTLYKYIFLTCTHSKRSAHTRTTLLCVCACVRVCPQRSNQPSPPPLSTLSVSPPLNSGCMYVNHPSLTQSLHWISFSAALHRACDWFTATFSLKLEWHTTLDCGDARQATRTHTHTHTQSAYMLLRWVSVARGESRVPMLPKRTPLRFTQGRHVQLAAPTSVQNGLKTGMGEVRLCSLTLDQWLQFFKK